MSEKPIMDHLNEAEKYADEITDLLARTVDFQKEKPGGRMQSFYRAMRVVHDNLSRLTPEERDRFDRLNERYKNLVGDIYRRLK